MIQRTQFANIGSGAGGASDRATLKSNVYFPSCPVRVEGRGSGGKQVRERSDGRGSLAMRGTYVAYVLAGGRPETVNILVGDVIAVPPSLDDEFMGVLYAKNGHSSGGSSGLQYMHLQNWSPAMVAEAHTCLASM